MKSLLMVGTKWDDSIGAEFCPIAEWDNNERGVSLNSRRFAISLILAIALISGLSTAEDGNVSADDGLLDQEGVVNGSDIEETTDIVEPTEPSTTEVETPLPGATSQDLEGTWILNTDDGQISVVLYQSEDILFGAANSQTPKPWNGVVTGSVFGDTVQIQILSLQDGVLVSTLIAGPASDGTIGGSLVQSDSNGNVKTGSVMGIMTNPETSGYTPANVPAAATTVAPVTPAPEATLPTTTKNTTVESKPFTDVTAIAEHMLSTFQDPSMRLPL
jgi:hypothetical protein